MNSDDKITIMFDTLAYSESLKAKGIEHPEVFAANLAKALNQNIYTKAEIDKMIDESLKKFSEQTHMMDKRLEKSNADLRAEMLKLNNRTISIIVSILGGLVLVTSAVSTFSHLLMR